jgi:hypothetical protein
MHRALVLFDQRRELQPFPDPNFPRPTQIFYRFLNGSGRSVDVIWQRTNDVIVLRQRWLNPSAVQKVLGRALNSQTSAGAPMPIE